MISSATELALKFTIITFVMLGWGVPLLVGIKPSRATLYVAIIAASIVLASTLLYNYTHLN